MMGGYDHTLCKPLWQKLDDTDIEAHNTTKKLLKKFANILGKVRKEKNVPATLLCSKKSNRLDMTGLDFPGTDSPFSLSHFCAHLTG